MPIYDFKCRGCGEEFERLVMGRTAGPCPRCGGKTLERLPSRFAVRGSHGFSGSIGSSCGPCTASSCAGCSLARRS